MSKIIIIGNSVAGFSCLEALIKGSSGNEITVITKSKYPAYNKSLLCDYFSGAVKEKDLFICAPDYYAKNNAVFMPEAEVVRVDFKRKRVALKSGEKLQFDYLVIASGSSVELPELPGKTKEGIFRLNGLDEAKSIKQRAALTNTVCLIGESRACDILAKIFLVKDKEIRIISPLKPEGFVSQDKCEWIDGFQAVEFIGEGSELKAVKLNNGKVLAAALIVLAGNALPVCDFLRDSAINIQDGYIVCDDAQQTNLENIFACGSVARHPGAGSREKSREQAAGEGVIVAMNIIALCARGKKLCQQTS